MAGRQGHLSIGQMDTDLSFQLLNGDPSLCSVLADSCATLYQNQNNSEIRIFREGFGTPTGFALPGVSRRSCCNSRSKSICDRGSANPGNRFNASMPSPGWQVLRLVAMMNLPLEVSDATRCKPLSSNYGPQSACLKPRETLEDDDRRYVAAKLVNIAQPLDRHQSGSRRARRPKTVDRPGAVPGSVR
jgi:hypothetical protein